MKQKTMQILVRADTSDLRSAIREFRIASGQWVIVEDFLDQILLASALRTREDAPRWAKWIDDVDITIKTGYCFIGEFVNGGTVEIPLGKPKLILAQASLPDKEMHSGFLRQFRVVKMDALGGITPTHIATDDKRGGWALRMRDLTANLLRDLERVEKPDTNRFSNVEVE